jgi:hypothetical protein
MTAAGIAGKAESPRPDALWAGRQIRAGMARTTAGGRADAFVRGAVVGSAFVVNIP